MDVNLEIRHLKLLAAVADEESVTAAGKRLHLTQSALSHQLRDAEEKLGTALFLRLGKRMALTAAGQKLVEVARRILKDLKAAEQEVLGLNGDTHGVIRLSTECYTCYHWLPPVLKPFSREFPRVEVRIIAEATRRPIEALLDGRLDLAVTSTAIRNQKLIFKPLFKDEMVVIVSPDHPLASRPYVTAKDFASEHLLVYALPREELTIYQKVLIPAGVAPRHVSRMELTEAIIEMVKAGLGIGVMARWAVTPQVEAGTLCALPLSAKGFHRQWSAAMIRHKATPPYLLKFAELLAANPMTISNRAVGSTSTSSVGRRVPRR